MDPQAIYENFRSTVAEHYFDMNGRVGRAQFWYFVLAAFVLGIGVAIVSAITFLPLGALLGLALLLPMAGMGARRLQDTGRNGTLVWALIIPAAILQVFSVLAMASGPFGVIGFLAFFFSIGWLLNLVVLIASIALIYFWVQPGDAGANAYGPPPVSMPVGVTP